MAESYDKYYLKLEIPLILLHHAHMLQVADKLYYIKLYCVHLVTIYD